MLSRLNKEEIAIRGSYYGFIISSLADRKKTVHFDSRR